MNKFILVVAAAASLVTIASRAQAIEYPVCSSISGRSGMVERCDFVTMEQCQASVSGMNGSCAANWRYAYGQPIERPVRRRQRERIY